MQDILNSIYISYGIYVIMDEILQTCFIIMTSLAAAPLASRDFVLEGFGNGRNVKTILRHKPKKKA